MKPQPNRPNCSNTFKRTHKQKMQFMYKIDLIFYRNCGFLGWILTIEPLRSGEDFRGGQTFLIMFIELDAKTEENIKYIIFILPFVIIE